MTNNILQVGNVTPGHLSTWATNGVLQDAGGASGGNITEMGITNNGNLAFTMNSAAISGPYVQLAFSVNTSTGAIISLTSYNGAAPGSLTFTVNGGTFTIPTGGNLPLFTASTSGDVPASGGSSSAFLRADGVWAVPPGGGGGSGTVVGPATSTGGDLAMFIGTTGQVIADTAISAANIVQNPGGVTASNIASFNGITGKYIIDSKFSLNNLPVFCAATGTNAIILTPLTGSALPPSLGNYMSFRFAAPATSSGPVTITVSPFATLPLYNQDIGAQSGSVASAPQDILMGALYSVTYNSTLNGGNGGFQVTDGPFTQMVSQPRLTMNGLNLGLVYPTLTSFAVDVNSSPAQTLRQASFAAIMNASTGAGQVNPTQARFAGIFGINGDVGGGDIWAVDASTNISAVFPAAQNAFGVEIDLVNSRQNYGTAAGPLGLAAPVAVGLNVNSAGSTFSSTTGIAIGGGGTWNRGLSITGSVGQAAVQDASTSPVSYQVYGAHAVGIDLAFGTYSTTGLRLPNNTPISWVNAAGTQLLNDTVDTNNTRYVGLGANSVVCGSNFFPIADNADELGVPTQRWASVWSVNGVIQTSDPAMKENVTPLASTRAVLHKLNPVTFNWKPDFDTQKGNRGRTHWGFLANEVAGAMATLGQDFGGYTRDETGSQHLAYHQLIAVLVKAVQEMDHDIQALKARLDA